jgi:hypothetical protein
METGKYPVGPVTSNTVFQQPVALTYHFTHLLPSLMQLCLQFLLNLK